MTYRSGSWRGFALLAVVISGEAAPERIRYSLEPICINNRYLVVVDQLLVEGVGLVEEEEHHINIVEETFQATS